MRLENAIVSAFQLLFILALLLIGGFLIAMEYAPILKYGFMVLMTSRFFDVRIVGCILVGVAMFLGGLLYWMQRKEYFGVQMERGQAIVEPNVIEGLVSGYWKGLFPEEDLKSHIVLQGHEKIEVVAEIPGMEWDQQEALLLRVEKELGVLLFSHLGYNRELTMTITLKNA